MRKIMVVTGTRAEYGLLYWTLKGIVENPNLELQLVVTGNHLSSEYGYTVKQIIDDGFEIVQEIDMLLDSKKKNSIIKSMAMEMIQLSDCMERLTPDILLILGDRYEIMAAATCAMMLNIPIAHMNGGECSEGAIDEQIRHAITKMAHIHFTGAETYRKNIINMGEEPWRVFNVGQAGIENIKRIPLLNREEIQSELKIDLNKKVFLITYHPETLSNMEVEKQVENLLQALDKFDAQLIFTSPNADHGGLIIKEKIEKYARNHINSKYYDNLGQKRYLSLLNYCDVVIGNSSSGLIEAPSFGVPVVNIGDRQKGRIRCNNIIDCRNNVEDIVHAITTALDKKFKNSIKHENSPFGDGNTSHMVVDILSKIQLNNKLFLKKSALGRNII